MEVNQNQQMGIHLSVRLNLEGYLDSDRSWVCFLMIIDSSSFKTTEEFIYIPPWDIYHFNCEKKLIMGSG